MPICRLTLTNRLALLLVLTLTAALAFACASTSMGAGMDDSEISSAVEGALGDSAVNKYNIGVTTEAGVVTLSGQVDDAVARDAAVAIAEGTEGVDEVVDELQVGKRDLGERGSDAWITTKVTAKLAADPQINPFGLRVKVNRGKVVLSGEVPTESARDEAIKLAQSVEGVSGVVDEITVEADHE